MIIKKLFVKPLIKNFNPLLRNKKYKTVRKLILIAFQEGIRVGEYKLFYYINCF